jgi:hypothetical protein
VDKAYDDTILVLSNGHEIFPQPSVKVLGVTLDKGLSIQEHVRRMTSKAKCATIAIRGHGDIKLAERR